MNLTLSETPKTSFLAPQLIFDLISALCKCSRKTVIDCHSITKITYMYIIRVQIMSASWCAEPINQPCRLKVKLKIMGPGCVVQLVTCLATDACLTAYPGVANSILAQSHTFMVIYHEIISTVILLPSADAFKKGCCQLQGKVCARITGKLLVQACPGKSVVR